MAERRTRLSAHLAGACLASLLALPAAAQTDGGADDPIGQVIEGEAPLPERPTPAVPAENALTPTSPGAAAPAAPADDPGVRATDSAPDSEASTGGALTREAIEAAAFDGAVPGEGPNPLVARAQVLLDRAGASPGVIDGVMGENVEKAIAAFEVMNRLEPDGALDADVWGLLTAEAAPVLQDYTLTEEDVAGPYAETIPQDYAAMAKMERLAYRSAAEMLAERFHMDEDFLKALNPDADFGSAGTVVTVASVGESVTAKVARLVADRGEGELLAYGADGALVAAYPATIGSADNPSPSGTHAVRAVATDPTYTYNPKVNFQQGDNTEVLTLPPGPNGPVGSVWIDLSEPTYGIHGTPEPSKIDKTGSHGCVRLTNWDAEELAKLVAKGVPVTFTD